MANTDARIAELQELIAEADIPLAAEVVAALEDAGFLIQPLDKVPGVIEGDEGLPRRALLLIPVGADEIRVHGRTVDRERAIVLLAGTPEAIQPNAA